MCVCIIYICVDFVCAYNNKLNIWMMCLCTHIRGFDGHLSLCGCVCVMCVYPLNVDSVHAKQTHRASTVELPMVVFGAKRGTEILDPVCCMPTERAVHKNQTKGI